MGRVAASITDIYGPSASLLFPSTAANPVAVGGSTGTVTGTAGLAGGGSVPITEVAGNLKGSILGQPLAWLFGIALVLVIWKLVEEHRGGEEAFQKIRVDGTNLVKVGLMATVFLIIARYFAARYNFPGLSDVIVGGT